jgi:hypothetical protein
VLEQRYLQKKGQSFVDPETGRPRPDAFESSTRFEMYDAAVVPRGGLTKVKRAATGNSAGDHQC